MKNFDIIVVGAGHAGIEAALCSAKLNLKILLVTSNLSRIGYMSCNPSIGGLAKGHMVRELDVLGGQMGIAADRSCIQFKRLNSSRGPAVRGTRVQCDKHIFSDIQKAALSSQANLSLLEGEVKRLILENNTCVGVVLSDGSEIRSQSVVITTGTFMNGVMHFGLKQLQGGRIGDAASVGLSDQLAEFGFSVKRLKTGTPARLHKDSIDYSKTTAQYGDDKFYPFSHTSSKEFYLKQIACFLSHTSEKTHEIIRNNLDKSPMFSGIIEGVGPRYCPSIEDKIFRFSDRSSHQTFLEPEGLNTDLVYLQGISTSLPEAVQDEFIRTIDGLENVKIIRYGYAVEYDFIEPTQIFHRLETRPIRNLFLAGQINGTSGYEEAAIQGFLAGINAAHKILGRDEFVLGRDEAYAGVLIDDLVTKGTKEPYRMFTSRAEHRLILREDNTSDRLLIRARSLGVLSDQSFELLSVLNEKRAQLTERLNTNHFYPNPTTNLLIENLGSTKLLKPVTIAEFLRRPEVDFNFLEKMDFKVNDNADVSDAVEIQIKYSGYIKKQYELIEQAKKSESVKIPESFDYKIVKGLSREELDKLSQIRPRTLGQAQRISGITPAAMHAIMIYLKHNNR